MYDIGRLAKLKQNEAEHPSTRCLHGMIPETCGLCNGLLDQRQKTKREPSELRDKYEQVKGFFKNFGSFWSEEEILIVYDHFKDISSKQFRKEVYKVALELERTTNAIRWMVKHIFSKRTDLHRGKTVIIFRESVGIKGGE